MTDQLDFNFESYLTRVRQGFSSDLGKRDSVICVQAAVCEALGMRHDDAPRCVEPAIRRFLIALNDADWSSKETRARWLNRIGIAQLGSLGVVDGAEFLKALTLRMVKEIVQDLFKRIQPVLGEAHLQETARDIVRVCGTANATNLEGVVEDACYMWHTLCEGKVCNPDLIGALRQTLESVTSMIRVSASNSANSMATDHGYRVLRNAAMAHYWCRFTSIHRNEDLYYQKGALLFLEVLKELHSPGVRLLVKSYMPAVEVGVGLEDHPKQHAEYVMSIISEMPDQEDELQPNRCQRKTLVQDHQTRTP